MNKNGWEKVMANVARGMAEKNVNSACIFVLHQPPIPAKVIQKLKRQ